MLALAAIVTPAAALAAEGSEPQGASQAQASHAEVQPAGGTDAQGIADIVVTAQFRKQSLQSTPISITALDDASLQQRSVTSIIDLAQTTPNVRMNVGSSNFGRSNQASVRGIGQTDFSFAFEPRVGFYIDDVYQSTVFGSVFDLVDVDRVEVLRGPQGVLFGRNSVGGAIRIFSKKPRGDGNGYVEMTGGSFDKFVIKGAIDIPLVTDTLSFRLSGSANRQDGYVDRINFACANPAVAGSLPGTGSAQGCKVGTLGGTNVYSVRGQLRWQPTSGIENNISATFMRDRSEPSGDVPLAVSYSDKAPLPVRPDNTPNGLALWLHNIGAPYYGLADPINPATTGAPTNPYKLAGTIPAGAAALLAALQPTDPYTTYAIYNNPGVGIGTGRGTASPCYAPVNSRAVCTQAQFQPAPLNIVHSWNISNTLDADLSDSLHLTSITAYQHYTGYFGSDVLSTPLPIQEVTHALRHSQFTQELRLNGSAFDSRVEWTVGGFYLHATGRDIGRIQTEGFSSFRFNAAAGMGAAAPSISDMVLNDRSRVSSIAGFVNGTWHMTDKLNATVGVRYTHENKSYDYLREYPGAVIGTTSSYSAPETSVGKVNPRVTVDYKIVPELLLYASYSTGFTAGGNNPRPFKVDDAKLTFDPENVTSYEIGFKSDLFDRRLRINASAYLTDWDQIQLQISGCQAGCLTTSPIFYGNAGDARIKGFEVEVEAAPVDGLILSLGLGYAHGKYTRLNYFTNTLRDPTTAVAYNPNSGLPAPANYIVDPTGLTLDSPTSRQPEWQISAGAQYTADLGGAGTVTPRVDIVRNSTTYFGSDRHNPLLREAPYTIANARITWTSESRNWSISGFVTNLTNKLYYANKQDQTNSYGFAIGQVAAPREWGLTVRRNF